jgi:hypothetical protein
MITVFPASATAGIYVKENGDAVAETGFTEPAPFVVIVRFVAFVNVLPLIVTGVIPQVFPLLLLSVSEGPFAQPQETVKAEPVDVHPAAFLTVMVWVPLATPVNVVPV